MKLKSLLLSSVLIATPWIASAQSSKKVDMKDVTNNLDMDGQFFMANNIEGDLGKIAALGTDYLQNSENGKGCFPKDMDFTAVLKDFGLDHLVAYGRSAKHAGDHWVSKMYIQNNGSKKGVFSMMGKANTTYEVIQFAPSGTDLVMEWSVDTRELEKSMKNVPKCERMEKFMNRKMPAGGTMKDILNKFTAKMSLAVRLDDEKREVCPVYPEYTFPKLHGCMKMQGANQIWKQVGNMAGFMMKVEKQDDGTILMTPRKQKKGMNAVMLMDAKNDTLWAATSPDFLAECRGDGAKLGDDKDFKTISDGVTKGSALAYISRQACLEIRQVKEAKMKKKGKKCLSDDMMKKIMDHVTESKNGYFAEIHKSKKGINYVLKAPCPVKEVMCGGRKGCKYSKGCKKGRSCGDKGKCKDKECGKACEGDKKAKCGCDEGKCSCAKDKSDCKCEDGCKCSEKESNVGPKAAKKADTPKKSNKKVSPKKEVAPASEEEAKAAVKKKGKPAAKEEASEEEVKPTPKKKVKPTPKKKAAQALKKEEKPAVKKKGKAAVKEEAKEAPKEEVKPAPKKKAKPAPKKKAVPAPKKEEPANDFFPGGDEGKMEKLS